MITSSLQKEYFDDIILGRKVYELRVNDEKRRQIQVDDVWKFDNLGDDKEHIYTKVYEIKVYSSFEEAIGDTDISLLLPSLGKNINSFEKAVNVYHSFPGYFENSKKYGVVRFKLQRIYYIDI